MISFYQGCGGIVPGETDHKSRLWHLSTYESSDRWVAEPKEDGIWVVADNRRVVSRTGKTKDVPGLPQLPPNTIIVGEASYGSQRMRTLRDQVGHHFIRVFDILWLHSEPVHELPAVSRQAALDQFYKIDPAYAEYYPRVPRYTSDFVRRYNEEHEGLVLKLREDGPYRFGGFYNPNWMKAKKFATADYVIMGRSMSDAKTKSGLVRHITLGGYIGGQLRVLGYVGSMTHEWAERFARNPFPYNGTVCEVGHYGLFNGGAPRHPFLIRLRDDKSPEDCVFDR